MGRWNPWRALRRREQARLRFRAVHPSAGGAYCEVHPDGTEHIYLDHSLDQVHRNAALAHELVHLERGLPHPHAPWALVQTEEARVRAETARRLVPPDELRAWATARTDDDPITLVDICDHFDVPTAVALEAARQAAA